MCCHSLMYHDRNTKISMLFSGICWRYYFCYLYAIALSNKGRAEACKSCFAVLNVESGRKSMIFQVKQRNQYVFKGKIRKLTKNEIKILSETWLCLCGEIIGSEKKTCGKVY